MNTLWSKTFETTLRNHLPLLAPEAEIEPEVALADLGLDSLGTVGLLVELEETFNVVIPDESLSTETFATPKSLWDVIDQLVKEQSR
ncbi:phosphopantetheine-binding protein [Streptomyces sp. N50]|uniref:phosphopantetheine-binding protein n=1 Tax=Streptomyces sp. N50 TaxID=3081765 RepID=UPI0029622026|nr:phosphopantetheine-binding protein [Streptomyces sp. N50]WOX17120.1 phosphopantetheine-binding protein [Streptomyces sp. N50]